MPVPHKPLDQTELVHRLDHAVFGVDERSGLLYTLRTVETKLDRLTGAIVVSSLSLSVAIVASTVALLSA